MKTYCESRSNQKYAANSRHADHAGEWQRFYLLFCCKKSGCARRFPVFFQHFRNDDSTSGFYQQRRHPRQHPVVVETSKGRCRKTVQRPFFVIASRRVHDDCITNCIIPCMRSSYAAEQENHAANFYSESILDHARITSSARLLAFAPRIVLCSKSI